MFRPRPRVQGKDKDKSGYLSEAPIAAAASAVGGPVAIVRASGSGVFRALDEMTGIEGFTGSREARKLYRVALRDRQGESIDDSMAVFFPSPNSFTGEDCVELHVHGGGFVVARVLGELAALGVRQALPGEFSFRAVRNGKMTLSQTEAVADLIAASNQGAVSLALEKLAGSQQRHLAGLADELRQLSTLGELGIDFSDQELDEVSLPTLKKSLKSLLPLLEALRDGFQRGTRLQEGVSVAFVGLPNAGKSSFFNALLGEDRSIVSEIAGTTRDVVRERLTLRGKSGTVTLRLEDLAGLRDSDDQVERLGVERTLRSVRDADFALLVVDATRVAEHNELLRKEWARLGDSSGRVVGILTKCDLVSEEAADDAITALAEFGVREWVRTSAFTGSGISEAATVISDFCEKWVHREPGEVLLTRLDHFEALNEGFTHFCRALEAPEIDLFAADVRQGLLALGPVIGETLPDDILGRIFAGFCIGK